MKAGEGPSVFNGDIVRYPTPPIERTESVKEKSPEGSATRKPNSILHKVSSSLNIGLHN